MRREKRYSEPGRRQRLFAWVILLVYLPTVLLSSVHVHPLQDFSDTIDCYQCETGSHHSGHITTNTHNHDACLSCRFLGTQVVVPEQQNLDRGTTRAIKVEYCQVTESCSRPVAHPTLRAPPVTL